MSEIRTSSRPKPRQASQNRRKAGGAPETGGRDRLLSAAIEIFSSRGYAASGIAEVCQRAGVAKTALYWHFGNKDALLAAVIEEVGIRWVERISASANGDLAPPLRVQRLVAEWRLVITDEPELLRLLLLAQLEQGDHEPARSALAIVWRRAEEALIEGIEEAVGTALPEVDLIAHTIVALLQAMMFRMIVDPDPVLLDRLLGELQRTFVLLIADRLPAGYVYSGDA